MKILNSIILLVVLSIGASQATYAQSVFYTSDSTKSNIRMAIVTDTVQADLLVFHVGTQADVNTHGQFYVCENINEAELKIYIETNPDKAQVKIAYVGSALITRWRHEEKVINFKVKK